MATGFSAATANALLNALFRNVSYANAEVWVQLHIGDPGAAATANPAVETDRIQGTFGSDPSGGAISNTVALTWVSVAGTEDYTHFSAWSASTAGTFLFSGTITAAAVTATDTFTIGIGDLDATLGIAA